MKWVSVKRGLPKFGVYIVHLENGAVMEMNFSDIGGNFWHKPGIGYAYESNPVTHWMPLPTPPKK